MNEQIQEVLRGLEKLPKDKAGEILSDLTMKIFNAKEKVLDEVVEGSYVRSISDGESGDKSVNLDVSKTRATIKVSGSSRPERSIYLDSTEFKLLLDLFREIVDKIDDAEEKMNPSKSDEDSVQKLIDWFKTREEQDQEKRNKKNPYSPDIYPWTKEWDYFTNRWVYRYNDNSTCPSGLEYLRHSSYSVL